MFNLHDDFSKFFTFAIQNSGPTARWSSKRCLSTIIFNATYPYSTLDRSLNIQAHSMLELTNRFHYADTEGIPRWLCMWSKNFPTHHIPLFFYGIILSVRVTNLWRRIVNMVCLSVLSQVSIVGFPLFGMTSHFIIFLPAYRFFFLIFVSFPLFSLIS